MREWGRGPWSGWPVLSSDRRVRHDRVHLPFESAEIRVVVWVQRGLMAWTLGTLALAGWWVWDTQALEDTAQRTEQAVQRSQHINQTWSQQMAQEGLTRSVEQMEGLRADVVFANQLAAKRSLSWTRLLSDLEETMPGQVSISSIKPRFEDSAVIMEGEARTLQDLDRFVRQLQQHPAFHHPVLGKHEVRGASAGEEGARRLRVPASQVGSQSVEYSLTVRYQPEL